MSLATEFARLSEAAAEARAHGSHDDTDDADYNVATFACNNRARIAAALSLMEIDEEVKREPG